MPLSLSLPNENYLEIYDDDDDEDIDDWLEVEPADDRRNDEDIRDMFNASEFAGCCGLTIIYNVTNRVNLYPDARGVYDKYQCNRSMVPVDPATRLYYTGAKANEFIDKAFEAEATTMRDNLKRLKKDGSPGAGFIATMNQIQYKFFGHIFHEAGWELIMHGAKSNLHNNRIYIFFFDTHPKSNPDPIANPIDPTFALNAIDKHYHFV